MNEKTKQLVRDLLAKAHAGALATVRERLEGLPVEAQQPAEQALLDCQACALQIFKGLLSQEEAEARMVSLIYGHTDPRVVDLVRAYAETARDMLIESRDRLMGKTAPRGH